MCRQVATSFRVDSNVCSVIQESSIKSVPESLIENSQVPCKNPERTVEHDFNYGKNDSVCQNRNQNVKLITEFRPKINEKLR